LRCLDRGKIGSDDLCPPDPGTVPHIDALDLRRGRPTMNPGVDNRPSDDESQLFERLQLAASQAPMHLTQQEVDRLLGVSEQQRSH
jgi:hypothetical protein